MCMDILVCVCACVLASFPGPAQLPVACSTVKRKRAWYISHMGDVTGRKAVERV